MFCHKTCVSCVYNKNKKEYSIQENENKGDNKYDAYPFQYHNCLCQSAGIFFHTFFMVVFPAQKRNFFFQMAGLYTAAAEKQMVDAPPFCCCVLLFYTFDFTQWISPETMEYLESSGSVSVNAFAGIGAAAIMPAFIENFIGNGVAEEILYRGFFCKRFCNKLGCVKGILLQAVLFGLMHNVLYLLAGLQVGLWYHVLMFLFTGMAALLLGWLNEKIYNGSILPGILLHGAGNFINSMLMAFSIM